MHSLPLAACSVAIFSSHRPMLGRWWELLMTSSKGRECRPPRHLFAIYPAPCFLCNKQIACPPRAMHNIYPSMYECPGARPWSYCVRATRIKGRYCKEHIGTYPRSVQPVIWTTAAGCEQKIERPPAMSLGLCAPCLLHSSPSTRRSSSHTHTHTWPELGSLLDTTRQEYDGNTPPESLLDLELVDSSEPPLNGDTTSTQTQLQSTAALFPMARHALILQINDSEPRCSTSTQFTDSMGTTNTSNTAVTDWLPFA
ncbi:hypothetical protein B0J11DRAFT_72348 [Dendryphion nanum]|uniref:Uncharacterized protein n=1 Tax=Dendryphion nanum TaxID=256645 RepID=A0A9P9DJ59_9PLEO|nr:hypothetical protein B0J11DRAFT_72348 [Dendryphion nanum]